jgi:predicted RND superfamily exporter protein
MILVTMGSLQLSGVPLGPIESLALAVIVGVSIDYLIHLAFAYQHSLMTQRYYKSRAAILARARSICAAALTTLCSVLPLLGARLQPLRQFGIIFTLVAIISFLFAMGFFNSAMMIAGPLRTRASISTDAASTTQLQQDDAAIQAAQEEMVEMETCDLAGGEAAPVGEAGLERVLYA